MVALCFGCILLGYFTGKRINPENKVFSYTGKVLFVLVILLVFLLGTMIGSDEKVISSIGSIGLTSLVLAIFAMAGSVFSVMALRRLLKIDRKGVKQSE
jgi:uncharacterized membrane protein YbhN (UPF0104 family)